MDRIDDRPSRIAKWNSNLGRHVFGAAGVAFGLVALVWHDDKDWSQLRYILNVTGRALFLYGAAAAQVFGGIALQFSRTARTGAVVLGAVYLVSTLLYVPGIVATTQIYDRWGNFFEQFSLLTGAAIVYARSASAWTPEMLDRIGRILMGICAASFTLEQAIHLDVTATLVPKWLPPNQMFWAITTTVSFALAAMALLTNRTALLATRLLTIMIVSFGLLVWVPLLVLNPRIHANWSETVETFAIAGSAWILADLLGGHRLIGHRPR